MKTLVAKILRRILYTLDAPMAFAERYPTPAALAWAGQI